MTQNDLDSESALGAPSSIISESDGRPNTASSNSNLAPSITYSQSDRLRRRLSNSSISTNGASLQGYKSQASVDQDDDDTRSNYSAAVSQSSFTTF